MGFGFRHLIRKLLKSPGFTGAALGTIALCLGANLAIYAVVDAIIVRALPFPEADRLVAVYNSYPKAGVDRASASFANYFDRRSALPAFSSVAVSNERDVTVGEGGAPARVSAARVSPEFFSTLGVPLAMGRTFTDAELTYQTDQVAVLTDGFWRSHFAADPHVLGRTFLNDGLTVQVIGVLPRDFRYLSSEAQIYRPMSADPAMRLPRERHDNNFEMIARLAPGATLADAQAQMDAFNAVQAKDDPLAAMVRDAGYHTVVKPLHEDHVGSVRPMLILLQCGGVLLLAIGTVNLTNLLLIRASGRSKELAVRQALGATPLHLSREILVECILLALLGGLLGMLVGSFGIRALGILGAGHLPLGTTIQFDARVAAASQLAALAMGVLLAVPVIWFSVRGSLSSGLHSEGRAGTASRASQRLRHGFIVAQIALAFVLLSGAGLLGQSLRKVLQSPAGFNPEGVLAGQINFPWHDYKTDRDRHAFVDRLLPAIRALPGISLASAVDGLPFSNTINNSAVDVPNSVAKPGASVRAHNLIAVSGSYFALMDIPLLQGRLLDDADGRRAERVCVVDQAFAERYWPGRSALGERLRDEVNDTSTPYSTIVGVVGNVRFRELAEAGDHGSVYFPLAGRSAYSAYLIVRTTLPPSSVAPMIRKAVQALDPGLPVTDLRLMRNRIDDSLVARRSPAVLAMVFSGVALVLASIGTYGLLAYAVSQRRREIGVRMALGAQPGQILRQFLGLGGYLLAVGITLGLLLAWISGRAMQGVLFGVGSFDAGVLAAATALITGVVLLAIYLPSRNASRGNPIESLRAE
jgi:predicted permease